MEENDSVEMGYHNLTAQQIDFEALDHLAFMEDAFLKQSSRLQQGKTFDKTLFSLSPGSIYTLENSNVMADLIEDYELMHFQHLILMIMMMKFILIHLI